MELFDIRYNKYKLPNGLEVILHQNKSIPLVALNIWYKVGSANEWKGKTGLAHLFEHMMFQGSQNVPKEMHFRFIQEAGGTLNGSTNYDRTNYYEKVPANFLELILWLESDRMGFWLPALTEEKLKNQKDVVSNERLERYDNQPYGRAWEILITNLYPEEHPYSWPTIGFMDDIKSYTLDDVSNFFKTFYSPANAALTVTGDFEESELKDLIHKYYGEIETVKNVPKLSPATPVLNQSKEIIHKEDVQLDRLYLAWHSEKVFHKNDSALDVLSDILTGSKSARLTRKIVHEKELAQDVFAYQFSGNLAGHFMIVATAKPGVELDTIKKEIFNELDAIKKNGLNKKELEKSKNGIKSSFVYSMQNIDSLADQLNAYNFYLNEPNSFAYDLKRYEDVEEENIQRVIEDYLQKPFIELKIKPNKKI